MTVLVAAVIAVGAVLALRYLYRNRGCSKGCSDCYYSFRCPAKRINSHRHKNLKS